MDERQQLLRAVSHGNLAAIQKIYELRSTGITWADLVYPHTLDSALHVAAQAGHVHIIKYNILLFLLSIRVEIFFFR